MSSCAVQVHFGDRHLSKQAQNQELHSDNLTVSMTFIITKMFKLLLNVIFNDKPVISCLELYYSKSGIENKPTLTDKLHV